MKKLIANRWRSMEQSAANSFENAAATAGVSNPTGDMLTHQPENATGSNKQLRASNENSSSATLYQPVKPITAYDQWFNDNITVIKQQNPTSTDQELSLIVASKWDGLRKSQRKIYNKKEEAALCEYMSELSIHQNQQEKPYHMQHKLGTSTTTLQSEQPGAQKQSKRSRRKKKGKKQEGQEHSQQNLDVLPDNVNTEGNTAPQVSTVHQEKMLPEASTGQLCIRDGCNKPAVHDPEWDGEYCSNECVLKDCKNAFQFFVKSNRKQ